MNNTKGFTLVELVVVVVVVGILATLAIPLYTGYIAKSQQSEVKSNLGAIYVGMLAYSAPLELDGFEGATLDNIGFLTDGDSRYTYTLVGPPTSDSFLARARGVSGQVIGDVWEIDETKEIRDLHPGFHE